ncbi:hypothetical protein TNCV_953421 [Trichonephila clavipes]|nr:hypothetical protein TNCV_953421 [Trichonephila clavipes]
MSDPYCPSENTPEIKFSHSNALKLSDRSSRVVKVSDRGWPCQEFEPCTTKDPPCRAAVRIKSVESSNASSRRCGVVVRRWSASSGLVHEQKSKVVRRNEVKTLLPDHIQQTINHLSKESFEAFFTTNVTGNLIPNKRLLNSAKYSEILRSRFVSFKKTFDRTFQHDLDPCHNSKWIQTFMGGNKMKIIDGPGNSPDLNPIENL